MYKILNQLLPNLPRTLIIVLLLNFCSVADGLLQAQVKGKMAIGPRVGWNISNVNLDNTNSVGNLAAGITVDYWFNRNSALSFDIIHSGEGYSVPLAEVKLSYIQLPMVYKTVFGTGENFFQPKIFLGGAPGFLTSAKVNDDNYKDQSRKVVFNLVGGMGSILNISKRLWLEAEGRAFWGLTSADIPAPGADPVKNRTVQISVGLLYGL